MKVTFIGHAAILIEAGSLSILSDPWWRAPCFGAQWWNYPEADLAPLTGRTIDYIYISHGHHDHFHPGTLRTLPAGSRYLVSSRTDVATALRELGYDVIEIGDDDALPLGDSGVTVRIIETYGSDTLMTVTDGTEVCVNLNDALHAAPPAVQDGFISRLKLLHPRIDYLFCGYGVASHFPNCYMIPGKDRVATAMRRQRHFNRQWASIVCRLQPTFGLPFAADVVLLESDLIWVNEITHNAERPVAAFRQICPGSTVRTFDIAPGFTLENGKVVREVLRSPITAADLQRDLPEQIKRADRYGSIAEAELQEVLALLQERLKTCEPYLATFPGDYRILISFRGGERGFVIEKRGARISLASADADAASGCDLVFKTRLAYLKWALSRQYGDEILFVGSGGVFNYRQRASLARQLHRELLVLLRQVPPPAPDKRARTGLVPMAKALVKRLIGRVDEDLYDLKKWTVFTA